MRSQTAFLAGVVLALAASPAAAGIVVGDSIRFFRAEGNAASGGEYGVADTDDPGHELFRTFSLNRLLELDFNAHGFKIDAISTAARPP